MDKQSKIEERRTYDREWKRQYKLKNPEKVKEKRRERYYRERKSPEWVERHKIYMRSYLKKWRQSEEQRRKHREYAKKWHRKNAKKIYAQRRKRPYEKLAATIRSRIYDLLKHGYKSDKTEKLLGCTMKKLKEHLEKQFTVGMTWENYGFYGWHADHIIPLSSFDLTNPEEQKKAFHYTNLQPLWAKENLHKYTKIS